MKWQAAHTNTMLFEKKKKNWPKLPLLVVSCHSLSLVVTRCHSLYHSLSFVIARCSTRCHSLYHLFSLVVSLAKWLSVRLRTTWLWVRVPLQSLKCITRLSFYKRSDNNITLDKNVKKTIFLRNLIYPFPREISRHTFTENIVTFSGTCLRKARKLDFLRKLCFIGEKESPLALSLHQKSHA